MAQKTQSFDAIVKNLAEEKNHTYVNLMFEGRPDEWLMPDSHPSDRMNQAIAQAIIQNIDSDILSRFNTDTE